MISSEIYQIGPIRYDCSTRILTHENGYTEYFTPRVSDVFLLLLEHQGQCVEKDYLLSQCWGDVIVSEQALTNVISKLRKILYKNCPDVFTITTVSKSGYLLEVIEGIGGIQKSVDNSDTDAIDLIDKEQMSNRRPTVISFDSKLSKVSWLASHKITLLLLLFCGVTVGMIFYKYHEIKSRPYFVNASSYSKLVNINNNNVYIHTIKNGGLDEDEIIKSLKKGLSSICNSEVYVRFYNNTRIKNHVGLVIFIMNKDGRAFNFRMSEYIKNNLGDKLNDYLLGKNVVC
ncbi:winged helix-turn-helix domain-containing protein [Photobacterium andalusiense]|uniref:Transcriptional activator CadC n=1 Tax=Photobacterium andalusiense TaxID=2204296 RepID=A0A1Y6MHL7_9GAMM|nr:winged helix-turn-helix domain-containing protein [Photobacterium andalusiense]SMY36033.1 Transcriptional activator CadC [Photobacterium andalusiense]